MRLAIHHTGPMDNETRLRFQELCHKVAIEEDSAKVFVLVKEINDLMEGSYAASTESL